MVIVAEAPLEGPSIIVNGIMLVSMTASILVVLQVVVLTQLPSGGPMRR